MNTSKNQKDARCNNTTQIIVTNNYYLQVTQNKSTVAAQTKITEENDVLKIVKLFTKTVFQELIKFASQTLLSNWSR